MWTLKFTSSWYETYGNISFSENVTYSSKYANLTYWAPYWYFYSYNSDSWNKTWTIWFLNNLATSVKTVSFWYDNTYSSTPLYSNNWIELKTYNSNKIALYIDGEYISNLWITSWWRFITLSLWTDWKLQIIVDWWAYSYTFNTSKKNFISWNFVLNRHSKYSTIKFFNNVITSQDSSFLYNEVYNWLPTLSINSWLNSTFNNFIDNYTFNFWNITETNNERGIVEYSINSEPYVRYWTGTYWNWENLTLTLPESLFFPWVNNLSLRIQDPYFLSSTYNFSINKNYYDGWNVSFSNKVVWDFLFLNNLNSYSWNNYFALTWLINYNKSISFPQSNISFQNSSSYITYNPSSANVQTISFFVKWSWELLNNTYFTLTNDTTNWFWLTKWGVNYLNIWPKDDNWHFIVLSLDKNEDKFYINIDWTDYLWNMIYYRDDLINWLKFQNWNFAFVKAFSQKLTDLEIIELYKSYDKFVPSISSTSSVLNMRTIDDFLNINVSVSDNDTLQNIEYYYSFDNINFHKIENFSTPTPVNSPQVVKISWSIIQSWASKLYFKSFDGKKYSNTLTFDVNKNDSSLEITVDESWLFKWWDKILKASINWWNLFYATTREDVCDETLNFLPYKDLTFSSTDDNWLKVCYKWVFFDNIIYKMSREINWIWDKTTTVKSSDIFYNYLSWKKWRLKDFDPMYILITSQVYNSVQWTSTTRSYPKLLTDVNWDWLPDLIFTNYNSQQLMKYPSWWWTPTPYYEDRYFYALLLNKWNMDYEVKYRCVYVNNDTDWRTWYYWDCAE